MDNIEKKLEEKNHERMCFLEGQNSRLKRRVELYNDQIDKLEKENSSLKKKVKESNKREIAPGYWTGTPEGDKIESVTTTALENDVPLSQLIDMLYFKWSISPADAIDTIFYCAETLGIDTSKVNVHEVYREAVQRNKIKDNVRRGFDRRGLHISNDVKEYYEKMCRTYPMLEHFWYKMLSCASLMEAQKTFIDLKDVLASKELASVYDFMNSEFTSTSI